MKEVWKDIKGYEGLYQISNLGRVKSLRSNQFLSGGNNGNGYQFVFLCNKKVNKRFYIHRLVALHFIPTKNNKLQVNHKDGNKSNNCVENLEWCTNKENLIHSVKYLNKHNPKPIKCVETDKTYYSISIAAKSFNMHHSHLLEHLAGKRKSFAGYHWKYV